MKSITNNTLLNNFTIINYRILIKEINMKKNNVHPEVDDIRHICDISPKTKITTDVCDKVNNDKTVTPKPKNSSKKKK